MIYMQSRTHNRPATTFDIQKEEPADGTTEREPAMGASYFKLSVGEETELRKLLARSGWDAMFVRKLLQNPDIVKSMHEHAMDHTAFRLIHRRFHALAQKLEMVRQWPGVTSQQVDAALKEAQGRITLFEQASPSEPLLNIVVSVYKEDAPSTLKYARDRMRDTFGDTFSQWDDAYGKEIDENRVRYLQGEDGQPIVPVYRNCVRIEVVDLGAHFNKKDGLIMQDVRGKDSAHVAVIYAAAQDPAWVLQIDGNNVPWCIAAGLELCVSGYAAWVSSPSVVCNDDEAGLGARNIVGRSHHAAVAVFRE